MAGAAEPGRSPAGASHARVEYYLRNGSGFTRQWDGPGEPCVCVTKELLRGPAGAGLKPLEGSNLKLKPAAVPRNPYQGIPNAVAAATASVATTRHRLPNEV